jgi:hypothetical protein
MKKLFLVAIFLGGLGLLSMGLCQNKAEAIPVEFDIQNMYSWARLYDYDGTDYTPNNSNPWDPGGVNNPGATIAADTVGESDTTEDTWGIAQVDGIQGLGADTTIFYDKESAAFEVTVFFWGFNDDYIDDPNLITGISTLAQVGGRVQVWADFTPDYDPTTFGTTDRGPLDGDYATVTEDILLLDMVPRELNAAHHTLFGNFNFATTVGGGEAWLDIVGGLWQPLYDTNSQFLGTDMLFTNTNRNNLTGPPDQVNDWVIRADGRGESFRTGVIPEPTTVVLLGIGLVGMAGVAVRRRLKKQEVEK